MVTKLQLKVIWFLCVLILLLGCGGKNKVKESYTDEESFQKAMELYRKKDYYNAKPAFTELRDKFPLSPYAITSELRLGDIHYFQREYVEAIHFYEEFKRLHPSNPHVPYAIYQLGMCYYKQVSYIDRDQTPAARASQYFYSLKTNYPLSPFAGSAMGKYTICRQKMFDHDFYIGHFYFRTKEYWAAKERFQSMLQDYPYGGARDKVLFYLGKTYVHLNEDVKAEAAFSRLVQDYPYSEYTPEAESFLNIPRQEVKQVEPEEEQAALEEEQVESEEEQSEGEQKKKKKRFFFF
jgi:outer membrane protein assembly factor BamD